ncbi:MAG: helix-turn-helix transcriptional regulator [Sulfurovaceae bacterium]|nr:helix-turn-helix transcriptional regulator [Sulfurovaceae bacterium]
MESLFFNTPTQRYQISETKVDISNGILFYDISLKNNSKTIYLKNLDRMIMMVVVKEGLLTVDNHRDNIKDTLKENSVTIYGSSRQDFTLTINGDAFILCIADFFLKRYLSLDSNEPIDFLYNKIQEEVSLEEINRQPIDALSLYLIDKIIHTKNDKNMRSIRCMHRVMEFITHRFSLLDMLDEELDKEELEIASRAKSHILKNFKTPPTIDMLAHLCATNESKLKKVFKKVYKSTIYSYVQRLRLEEANLLLREELMTIGEIAKKVGYKHQGHFSKLFFQTYGVYPKDLLKRR